MEGGWRQQLSACWDSVALGLPQLLGQSLGPWLGSLSGNPAAAAIGQEYDLKERKLKVVRQLGEGGYSFVYLVREVTAAAGAAAGGASGSAPLTPPAPGGGQTFALKRVLCGSQDQVAEAEAEVEVMRRLKHPCLLPLLDAITLQQQAGAATALDDGCRHVVLMLFPVYDEGNLYDFVQQQRQQQAQQQQQGAVRAAADGSAPTSTQQWRQLRLLLQIFLQVCAALHSMHSMDPPLAHRDVKPQNVLLRKRQLEGSLRGGDGSSYRSSRSGGSSRYSRHSRGRYLPMPQLSLEAELRGQRRQRQLAERPWEAGEWDASGSGSGSGAGGGEAGGSAAAAPAAVIAVEAEGDTPAQQRERERRRQEEWWRQRVEGWRQQYEAVLMDFGSTRPARVEVRSRQQAMGVQEDAERQCTAPYRAPELWDVPSSCNIDERVDVWSLGCLLYYMVCGQSPFERAAGEAGGSLMLSVVNGRLSWPADAHNCPSSIRQLVAACLDTDPATRPSVAEVAAQADRILMAEVAVQADRAPAPAPAPAMEEKA